MEDLLLAPQLSSIQHWINSGHINIGRIKHRVVAIKFWSHSCGKSHISINKMQKLYEKYASGGFVVIGVHSPQIETDKNIDAIGAYIEKNHITFPIGVDNDMIVSNEYGQKHFPALVLVDSNGLVRSQHIGEGGYHKIEKEIVHLLKEL